MKGGLSVQNPILPCLTFDPQLNCVGKHLLPHGAVQAALAVKAAL